MNNIEKATYIVEKIVAKNLNFVVNYTEYNEDGSFSIHYTERTQKMFDEILNLLENENSTS